MNYRSFIALEAPAAARESLVHCLRQFRATPGVKWVEERNLHLTLLFLGDVDSVRIPELESLLDDAVGGLKSFPLALKGVELFPAREPRLVWASLAARDDALVRLHKELLGSLHREGFDPDAKPLKLHITLGRIRAGLSPELERELMRSAVDREMYPYDSLTLYRSVLRPEGPSYHVLKQYSLA